MLAVLVLPAATPPVRPTKNIVNFQGRTTEVNVTILEIFRPKKFALLPQIAATYVHI
jgi:hypothetical protein